jgi:putative transposase
MQGKRATTEQIIAVLKEAEAGAKPMEPCRNYGISDQTLYNWKAEYGGRTVSEARRLKDLEQTPNRVAADKVNGRGAVAGVTRIDGCPGVSSGRDGTSRRKGLQANESWSVATACVRILTPPPPSPSRG